MALAPNARGLALWLGLQDFVCIGSHAMSCLDGQLLWDVMGLLRILTSDYHEPCAMASPLGPM